MSKYARDNINAMQGYTSGEQPQDPDTIKLNTNENPYPPSPEVTKVLQGLNADSLRTYPQPTADPLRDALAQLHGLDRDNVVVTNGGDEALRLAITTFVEPGCGFGMAQPSYSLYSVLADIQDAPVTRIPLDDDWQHPTDFAARLNQAGVQLTCLVNPHAPSGTLYQEPVLSQIAQALEGVLLIDEAYADFVAPSQAYNSTTLLRTFDNVLILRTFSKGYGLAGLRLGYLLGSSDLIAPILEKTRDSYNIDHISQALGLAAILDQEYAANTWAQVRQDRQSLQNNLSQLGLLSSPSESNFLLVQIPSMTKLNAQALYEELKRRNILVRYFDHPGLHDKLRITVGTSAQNEKLVDELTDLLT